MPASVPPEPRPVQEMPDARVRAVLDIGRALGSTLDLDPLLGLVMDRITAVLGAERSTLYLIDRERNEIWSKVAQGEGTREIRLPMGRGLAGFVAETGRSVNLRNAYEDPRFNPDVDRTTGYHTASVLTVPLRGKDGRVIGVAQALNRRDGGPFTVEDERTLSSMSSLIGIALENASLYSEVKARNAELEATQQKLRQKVAEVDLLFEIEREISASAGLGQMLCGILDRAMATVAAEAGAVLLLDGAVGELHFKRAMSTGVERLPQGRMEPAGVLRRVVETGQPAVLEDAREAEGSLMALAGYPARSLLCVPLPGSGPGARVLGALELADKLPEAFTADDQKLASLVAAQVARAVSLARTRAESERAGRLAALGQMLGGIVHDLRSPMTVIGGYAELMVREADAAAREGYARRILAQFEHVNALTREVLAFVRGERQLLVRRIQVEQFWNDLRPVLVREFESRRQELDVECVFVGAARFDEAKLKRLVTNLARNAAQAMGPGGRFRVRCEADGDALLLHFSDTGSGIPPDVAARLFEAFNSGGKPGGTGLGLAIVKEVVESHGGTIDFETEPGRGTTFTVRLPAAIVP